MSATSVGMMHVSSERPECTTHPMRCQTSLNVYGPEYGHFCRIPGRILSKDAGLQA